MSPADGAGEQVSGSKSAADWWKEAVVYQIYPRSFADADGDGVGDLAGITSRIPYLISLGIDAVWLSPFYPSALADGGYDVDDYRAVDPRLGSMADFDAMSTALHAAGLKLIVDIVPNHTSNRHLWFQEALSSPKGSSARDRYIFRDGKGAEGADPPADWNSLFGGPAWTQVADGQWYLHLFAAEQPDLNWDNPEVRQDFLTTLRFWADRGADGFRVDVAHGLSKNLVEPLANEAELPDSTLPHGEHPLWDRDEVHAIYAEWRGVFDEYDPPRFGVAEAWVHSSRRHRYASPDGLGQAFNFDLLTADWDRTQFRKIIDEHLTEANLTGATNTWVLSNHDVIRHPSRYGFPPDDQHAASQAWLQSDGTTPIMDRASGLRRARAATLLLLALPGSCYLYQGEELGLHEVADLPATVLQDPVYTRSGRTIKGRDGCRVPLPWTPDGPSYGFGAAGANLPQPPWFAEVCVQAQVNDPGSTLSLYRAALRARRDSAKLKKNAPVEWIAAADDVLAFRRGDFVNLTNFSASAVGLPASVRDGRVILTSSNEAPGRLPAETTLWLNLGE